MTDTEPRIEKICPVVLRRNGEGFDILAFRHPEAGNQIIQVMLEDDEAPRTAALRELTEESGLKADGEPLDLGKSKGIEKSEAWHFFACPVSTAPDEWVHTAPDDSEQEFSFFWQPFADFVDEEEWHPAFIRVIRFAQSKLERMDEATRNRIAPKRDSGLADTIMTMAHERGAEKSLCPSEVARAIAGKDEKQWRALMKPIRAEAVRMARAGNVAITRKGKPVDPDDFKGIYRIALPK
ncbi:DUF3253 domain-containing protein [Pseudahrensia aquimaris]|uniref:DUF3253 domain-containing protein n=1 Tax=Pseudahrensia aquimaris TaxID=744461 RepID=A0ABW3FGX4_9HYPH